MSGLPQVTYQTIIDTVKNWIKTNCSNITNYDGMSNTVKNGYVITIGSSSAGDAYSESARTILSSPLTSVASSTVDSDMNAFLSSVGASEILSSNISPEYFLKFVNDMVSFCSTKVAYISSQSSSASNSSISYTIYYPNNTTYNNTQTVSSSTLLRYIAKANDVETLLSNIVSLLTQNIRIASCTFSYSIG